MTPCFYKEFLVNSSENLKIMKFKLNTSNILLGIAIVIIVFLLYQWKCNATKAAPDGKKQNDSLKEVINQVQMASTEKQSSLARDNDSLIDQNITTQMRVSDLTGSLEASKKKIKELQVLVKSPDTIGLIDPACASLSDEFDKYVVLSDQKEKGQDTIIQNQKTIITNKDSVITEKDKLNISTNNAFVMVANNYDDLYKSYNKQAKNIKWQKTKSKVMTGVILAGVIKIILDASKK
jgi:hypothetical protein